MHLYSSPAGEGVAKELGPGRRRNIEPVTARAGAGVRSGNWWNLGVPDGVPQTGEILQDEEGALWLATDLGVSRFDGVHVTSYEVSKVLHDGFVNGNPPRPEGEPLGGARHADLRWKGGRAEPLRRRRLARLPRRGRAAVQLPHRGRRGRGRPPVVRGRPGGQLPRGEPPDQLYPGAWIARPPLCSTCWAPGTGRCGWRPSAGCPASTAPPSPTTPRRTGLPGGGVQTIAEDSSGRLWVAGYGGVAYRDGEAFRPLRNRRPRTGHRGRGGPLRQPVVRIEVRFASIRRGGGAVPWERKTAC